MNQRYAHALCILLAAVTVSASAAAPKDANDAVVERVGDTAFLQLKSDSFAGLDGRQKELAYWLSEAAIAVDPIIYDQRSRFGLRQKRLLEELRAHGAGVDAKVAGKLDAFTKLFWANRGNHNEYTSRKFLPDFTFEQLRAAARIAQKNGAFKGAYGTLAPLATQVELDRELEGLKPSLFDASFEPMVTAKSPEGGKDIIQASANNFYSGVTLADLKGFKEKYALNSRLVKTPGGTLEEQVWRAGTPDGKIPAGGYALYLTKANEYLEKAAAVSDPEQAQAIRDLVKFYRTGERADWLKHGEDWVRNDAKVDFSNGFVEVYLDPRGAKGSMQGFVTVTDNTLDHMMKTLADNALYFEKKAPWADEYKKLSVKPPKAKAVDTLIETADFAVSTIGDNLPNEDEIHEKFGTKSFLFTEASHALAHAGFPMIREFAASKQEVESASKHFDEADDFMTALHEIIGHGSGKIKVSGDPASYLKEYYSTLEEARADLMALWNIWDPKLKELGLISDQEAVAREMYYQAARAPLTQLRRIPKGDTIEEDHQRDRQLIVHYIMDKTGAIAYETRKGKTYVVIKDFDKMRQGVGMLLAELMRIKAEGDYPAIKALIDKYAVRFDPKVRDEVIARYKKLDLPTYWAGVNPELTAALDAKGAVTGVSMTYPRDAARQYLRYAAMYAPDLEPAAAGTAAQ
jgi:dipeptidyl-peptidase-3